MKPSERRRHWLLSLGLALLFLVVALSAAAFFYPRLLSVLLTGDSRQLRDERKGPPQGLTADRSPLLILAMDGVGKDVLYPLLRKGELPELAKLLGGGGGSEGFSHAHFEESATSVLPSSTMPAWAAIFTGSTSAENGVPGDEFFLRESMTFAAPVPISVAAPKPLAAVYIDDSLGKLLQVPTIYERLREEEPQIRIWVSMSQIYTGADRLLLGSRSVLGEAFSARLLRAASASEKGVRALWSQLSEELIETILDELAEGPSPEVLTVYFPFTDFIAHNAEPGPDVEVAQYLKEVIDPLIGRLADTLRSADALSDRYVVLVADHGHAAVVNDDAHAMPAEEEPAAVLRSAGFRLRPFVWETDERNFQAVLASQGAMLSVYLADRSTCSAPEAICTWTEPPRDQEDLLAAAEAFWRANREEGSAMRDRLELILVRGPRATGAGAPPFQVYVGDGKREPVESYLEAHPQPRYLAFAERLQDLAVGAHGERAGDLLLVPRFGAERDPAHRYYFSAPEHSTHGSPSVQEAEIPLIIAHPGKSTGGLREQAHQVLGLEARQHRIGDLLLELRRTPSER